MAGLGINHLCRCRAVTMYTIIMAYVVFYILEETRPLRKSPIPTPHFQPM